MEWMANPHVRLCKSPYGIEENRTGMLMRFGVSCASTKPGVVFLFGLVKMNAPGRGQGDPPG